MTNIIASVPEGAEASISVKNDKWTLSNWHIDFKGEVVSGANVFRAVAAMILAKADEIDASPVPLECENINYNGVNCQSVTISAARQTEWDA
jgi:hypothetical protein